MKKLLLGILIMNAVLYAEWRDEANRRIETIRKGDLEVQLLDEEGNPLGSQGVRIELKRHHFMFGSAISIHMLDRKGPGPDRYREIFETLFSAVVAENAMKWYTTQAEPGPQTFDKADRIIEFAKKNDLKLRGHCLLWSKEKWQTDWVRELEPPQLREALDAHLQTTLEYFKGKTVAWDLNNEMLDGDFYQRNLGDDFRPGLLKQVQELDPSVPYYLNEYSILNQKDRVEKYLELKEQIEAGGGTIGGFGIQEHAAERILWHTLDEDRPERKWTPTLTPEGIWESLDRLGESGIPIHITEISFAAKEAQQRADALDMFYRVMFAHPSVDALMLWGFWEGAHWMGKKRLCLKGRS